LNESEKIEEWIRHYKSCHLKMNALQAILKNDGEQMLQKVLKKLGLASASDVIKAESNEARSQDRR
jgi:hypothetical protein